MVTRNHAGGAHGVGPQGFARASFASLGETSLSPAGGARTEID